MTALKTGLFIAGVAVCVFAYLIYTNNSGGAVSLIDSLPDSVTNVKEESSVDMNGELVYRLTCEMSDDAFHVWSKTMGMTEYPSGYRFQVDSVRFTLLKGNGSITVVAGP